MTDEQFQRALELKGKQEKLTQQLKTLRTHTGDPAFLQAFMNMWYVPDSLIQGLRAQLKAHFEQELKLATEELEKM